MTLNIIAHPFYDCNTKKEKCSNIIPVNFFALFIFIVDIFNPPCYNTTATPIKYSNFLSTPRGVYFFRENTEYGSNTCFKLFSLMKEFVGVATRERYSTGAVPLRGGALNFVPLWGFIVDILKCPCYNTNATLLKINLCFFPERGSILFAFLFSRNKSQNIGRNTCSGLICFHGNKEVLMALQPRNGILRAVP